ncbi:MAG TPA: molybdate ABC transporter substrate-binding protein [Ruminiclostridium sp.]
MRQIKNRISILLITSIMLLMMLSGCTTTSSDGQVTSSEVSKATSSEVSATSTSISSEKVEIVVSAAASLTDVAAEIADMYKSIAPNITITYSFGSSGALQTQIEEGAPTDVFMSAAIKQMTALEGKGLIKEGTKKELLLNKVVLITPKDSTKIITSFEDAATDKVSIIALGEPSSVPVGQYAQEIFTTLSILDLVKAKANYGSDVRQVLTWVESGEVDCGVVYATDAATSQKITVVCEAPKDSHKPVIYPVAVLKSSKHSVEAQAFLDYLSTPEVVKVFEKYGFKMK